MSAEKWLYNDCFEMFEQMEDDSVELVFTSPPYYNARSYIHYQRYEDYLNFLEATFDEVFRVLKPAHSFVLNVSPVIEPRQSRQHASKRYPIPHDATHIATRYFEFVDHIIWIKPDGAAKNRVAGFERHRRPRAYKPNIVTEDILVFQKPSQHLVDKTLKEGSRVEEYDRTNVWHINPESRKDHPAPFPLELADRVVKYYSYEGETVVDPFAGSGTTLVAAKSRRRHYVGAENIEAYRQVIRRRMT